MTRNLLLSSAIAMFLAAPAMAQTTPPAASPDKPAATDADKPATMGTDKPAASTDMKTGTDTGTSTTGAATTGTAGATTTAGAGGPFIDKQEAGQMRADEIIGASVKNPQDEDIGKINDLLFDEGGKIVGAVVSVGGFLGMGAKEVAVDWSELQVRSSDSIVVKWTKDELKAAPDFKTQEDIKAEQDSAARSTGTPPSGGMGGSPASPSR